MDVCGCDVISLRYQVVTVVCTRTVLYGPCDAKQRGRMYEIETEEGEFV
jgi:hypothetical protein